MRAALARLALGAALATGCDTPVPALQLQLSSGPAAACPSDACSEVGLSCPSYLSIRILDPAQPDAPYLSQCTPVPLDGRDSACALATANLEAARLPIRDLEVQVAVFPASMVEDPITGEIACPVGVTYDAADGFPVPGGLLPALGGRAYYRPGDEVVTVTLGCTDLSLVDDPTCAGSGGVVDVAATVDDFDLRLPVDAATADRLAVGVGEPRVKDNQYVLTPGNVTQLERAPVATAWIGSVDQLFTSFACLSVLDDAPQSTTTLTCRRAGVLDDRLTFVGARLASSSLTQIQTAVGLPVFPSAGITIGLVLDVNGNPIPNQVVSAPGATIQYVSADRTGTVAGATSASGIFVSTDAPFGTQFTTTRGAIAAATGLGGLVEGKVTITILRFTEPIVGG